MNAAAGRIAGVVCTRVSVVTIRCWSTGAFTGHAGVSRRACIAVVTRAAFIGCLRFAETANANAEQALIV